MRFTKFSNPDNFMENGGCCGTGTSTNINPSPSTPSGAPSASNPHTSAAPTPSTSTVNNNSNATPKVKVHTGTNAYKESVDHETLMNIYEQYMDIHHIDTLNGLMSLNEAEQNSLLLSLTNKLYKMIVGKIDDVDFGDIPNTKGDIRRYSKYGQLRECAKVLSEIFVQYKEDPTPVNEIEKALDNLEENRDLFMASYAGGIEFGMMVYSTVALAIVESISFMIAVTIEYIKDPKNDGLTIIIDKTGVGKVKDHLLYENIIRFNESCAKGDIEKAIRPLIKNKVKKLFSASAGALILGLQIVVAVGAFIFAVIPLLRDLVYFFFATRTRVSTYLDIQADLLEMNANELSSNSSIRTEKDKDTVIKRQLAISRMFHTAADKIAVECKSAEVQATKEIKNDSRKYRLDDVNTNPANDDSDGSLF